MPRAKQRTPELRDHVLVVAAEVLARDGVAGFTTRRVAAEAETSPPAVYELFGDKAGLVRALFFEGFRTLGRELAACAMTDDPVVDLSAQAAAFRRFSADRPVLAEVMFARPFADFDPAPEDRAAGTAVREAVVGAVRRGIDAGVLEGDATDIAHALLALTLGLAAAERASRLGTSTASVTRRWDLAVAALLRGFAP